MCCSVSFQNQIDALPDFLSPPEEVLAQLDVEAAQSDMRELHFERLLETRVEKERESERVIEKLEADFERFKAEKREIVRRREEEKQRRKEVKRVEGKVKESSEESMVESEKPQKTVRRKNPRHQRAPDNTAPKPPSSTLYHF